MTSADQDDESRQFERAWAEAKADCPDLDDNEIWARTRLAPLIGPMWCVDVVGGPEAIHDFEADLPGGGIAAIEVTSETNGDRRGVQSQIDRRGLSGYLIEGTTSWIFSLTDAAKVASLDRDVLHQVIGPLIESGRRHASNFGDYRDPMVEVLGRLGISHVHALDTSAGGHVFVHADGFGGVAWTGEAVDGWLAELLASDKGLNKLGKLERSHAEQRHLVVVFDSWTDAGLGIPLGITVRHERGADHYELPNFRPPDAVTHVWLLPSTTTGEGLTWCRDDGWAIVPPYRTRTWPA
jgi:hypothetical protein